MMAQRQNIEQTRGAYVGGRAVRGRGDGAGHDGAAAGGSERGGAALAPAAASEGRQLLLPLRWRGGRGPCADRERAPLRRRCGGRGTESGHARISTARTLLISTLQRISAAVARLAHSLPTHNKKKRRSRYYRKEANEWKWNAAKNKNRQDQASARTDGVSRGQEHNHQQDEAIAHSPMLYMLY